MAITVLRLPTIIAIIFITVVITSELLYTVTAVISYHRLSPHLQPRNNSGCMLLLLLLTPMMLMQSIEFVKISLVNSR